MCCGKKKPSRKSVKKGNSRLIKKKKPEDVKNVNNPGQQASPPLDG